MKNLNFTQLTGFFCCPSLFFIFILNTASAQDTITVQTFTLQSETRSEVFEFPDDPNQTYEKILMLYTMRCHDNAIGSGNVGCREWDYSCNTFVIDSSRVDSTRQFHPNFVISNFNEQEFAYSESPTYSYTQYEQVQVNYTDVLSETVSTVGNGTFSSGLGDNQKTIKSQFLYSATELAAAGVTAGDITGLELDVTALGNELSFFRVRLRSTNKTALSTSDPDLDGFTEVYFLNTNFTATGPQRLNFHNTFDWDGTSNIIVELSLTKQEALEGNMVMMNDAGFDAALVSTTNDHYLEFGGIGNADIPTAGFSNISDEITISFWSYGTAETMPANSSVFEGRDDDDIRQANAHVPWSNGQVYWDCGNDGSGYDRINKTALESDYEGKWNHWAFTKNATTGVMNIYLNGTLWHSGTGKFKSIDITKFNFGGDALESLFYYGKLDEFRVWNKALSAETIAEWMHKTVDATHSDYNNLVAYYPLNEGTGNVLSDQSPNAETGSIDFFPEWNSFRGKDLFNHFYTATFRPNLGFVQGEYLIEEQVITLLDSIANPLHQVVGYEVIGTDLVTTDTNFYYPAGNQFVYDENGIVVGSIEIASDGVLMLEDMTYFQKTPAKYEILSLVTPYGNGLSLGSAGKTFTFDVTDYAPILKGNKRLSIEMGGQWQEELDLKFLYIKGTPPRKVIDIQNIWPFRRGWFTQILEDRFFEPRPMMMHPDGNTFQVKSTITGHGQNGEFVPQNHYINIDGANQEFTYQVWTECGNIPIYPQGGTWLFDRAGWCPGDPSETHRFDITSMVTPGEITMIDYGLNGSDPGEANYLVSNQLVTYGAPNFNQDAALLDIMRPSKRVEHERINPACNLPIVVIQNTGITNLTSLTIDYWVDGGEVLSYPWNGNLSFMEKEEVTLPVDDLNFWSNPGGQNIFYASVSQPNGGSDEYSNNNTLSSEYRNVTVFEGNMLLNYNTNGRGFENKMYLRDAAGNIVLQRETMANYTSYTDELDLAPGCYSIEFLDSGDDGLYYWYWDAIGQNIGAGSLRFQIELDNGFVITLHSFEPEFGSSIHFDFVLADDMVPVENVDKLQSYISLFPNPTNDIFTVELGGFDNEEVILELFDLNGRLLQNRNFTGTSELVNEQFNLNGYANGLYYLRIQHGEEVWVKQVVKD